MEIEYKKGIIVKADNFRIMLDPTYTKTPLGVHTLVTHAHSDHTQVLVGNSRTHLNKITLDLHNVAHKRKGKETIIHDFYEPFELGPFELEFVKAGHLLGAAQIVVRHGNNAFLYTGDFCPESLLTVDGADTPKDIDILAIDATYGNEQIHFQTRKASRSNILTWVIKHIQTGKIPVLNITKLGGAQEVIMFLNQLMPTLPIITDKVISDINMIYEKYNQKLNYVDIFDPRTKELMEGKCVIILPRSTKKLEAIIPNNILSRVQRCIVTGQSAKFGFSKFDHAVPLSTHASYSEIMDTIKTINPKLVLTNFGYHKELAFKITTDPSIDCDANSMREMGCINVSSYRHNSIKVATKNGFERWFDYL